MEGALGGLLSFSPILLMGLVFYLFLIRPQQKRQKEVSQMQSDLKKGDQIVTIGGLYGTVDAIDEDKIVITVDKGHKLTFDRNAIKRVVAQSDTTPAEQI
ncbi:preprotein translocase subunit YajC [Amphibacillus marinus]|uniref:Preprotein translocase subunit YajC n=1 Tax=Amphibacillus marinus TaxID=872970 RepID=A0A1H8P0G5_9BACI|nr:preprotein translocase subunit YajC [Amphibacillus marinus]SEO35241.1 preprotein translocase subunit YajC [Amphibacillus marinus]